ncbi:MAG: nitroreductase family protein [Asgard group archaeon]|nr:nitroreductase family protein [Asgard group archaeon]
MITLKILGVHQKDCISCLKCVQVCPNDLFSVKGDNTEKQKVVFNDPLNRCIECGHCLAICPTKAVTYETTQKVFEPDKKKTQPSITYEQLLNFLRMRRSIRVYKDQSLEKEEIKAVLEAIRYAPSSSNSQGWHFIVLTDPTEIRYLADETMKMFQLAKKFLPLKYLIAPFVGKRMPTRLLNPKVKKFLENAVEDIKEGKDIIFFDAPCVIILFSREYGSFLAANNAGIALTHGMLAAHSLGLGTCWIGFAQRRLEKKRKLRKYFGIPKGYHVMGVMTLGKPAIKYLRGPPRRPLRVDWVE